MIASQKELRRSYLTAGIPFVEAAKKFGDLIKQHSENYLNALQQMEKMGIEYGKILEEFKNASS